MTPEEMKEWLRARAVKARLEGFSCLVIRTQTNIGFYARFARWDFGANRPPTMGDKDGACLWLYGQAMERAVTLKEVAKRLVGKKVQALPAHGALSLTQRKFEGNREVKLPGQVCSQVQLGNEGPEVKAEQVGTSGSTRTRTRTRTNRGRKEG